MKVWFELSCSQKVSITDQCFIVLFMISLDYISLIMNVVPSKIKSNARTDKSKAHQKLHESQQYDPLAYVEEDTQRSCSRASRETKRRCLSIAESEL